MLENHTTSLDIPLGVEREPVAYFSTHFSSSYWPREHRHATTASQASAVLKHMLREWKKACSGTATVSENL